MIRKFTSI